MLSQNRTKVVCTIGPSSRSPDVLRELLESGMNIARLNFSHGDYQSHKKDLKTIRTTADKMGKSVAIIADLPGPKIRIGDLIDDEINLLSGQPIILTSNERVETSDKIPVNFKQLHKVVVPGVSIFLNDGFIQLEVDSVNGADVHCRVVVGGLLRSRKGMNIPDVELGVSTFTDKDRQIARFALEIGVDALSLSFVQSGADVAQLRNFTSSLGASPFIIAKIERSQAIRNLDDILQQADGIMVARGDLGVEIPIAQIPVVQKAIVKKARMAGKPVITATHMLESMINHVIPTRAEATDVANAILDGTDCVMLSGESAVGRYPVEAVKTLCAIAAEAEALQHCDVYKDEKLHSTNESSEIIASSVRAATFRLHPETVVVPTRSGATARNITRHRLPVWVFGVSSKQKTCRDLIFFYGVLPIHEPEHPERWRQWIRSTMKKYQLGSRWVILTEGPSAKYPDRNNRMEIIDLKRL